MEEKQQRNWRKNTYKKSKRKYQEWLKKKMLKNVRGRRKKRKEKQQQAELQEKKEIAEKSFRNG